MNKFLLVFFLGLMVLYCNADGTCDQDVNNCFTDRKCRKTLTHLLEHKCKNLFSNFNYFSSESSKISCSRSCRKALSRAKRGNLNRMLTCQSNNSEYFPYQDRALRCLSGKISEVPHDNYVANGCSKIFKKCTKHTHCRRQYEKMMFTCNEMILGSRCSAACEVAIQQFLASKKTFGFFKCQCDGAFYFQKTCHSMKKNILALCVSKPFKQFIKKRVVNE